MNIFHTMATLYSECSLSKGYSILCTGYISSICFTTHNTGYIDSLCTECISVQNTRNISICYNSLIYLFFDCPSVVFMQHDNKCKAKCNLGHK